MARTAEFNLDDVLQKAMEVFWLGGYCKSSMSSLVTATHLQPGSIYAAFNSKEGLFLAALKYYGQHSVEKLQGCLDQAETPLQGVRKFIEMIGERVLDHEQQPGCFLVNTVLEISTEETAINEEVNKHLKSIESHLLSALVAAQKSGELPPGKNPEALAKHLMINIWGLQVLAKTKPDPDSVKAVLGQVLSLLET